MQVKADRRKERELDDKHGIRYNVGSAALVKFRAVANRAGGVMKLDRFYRVEYADAVEAAILAGHRAHLKSHGEPNTRPMCASGTWHSDGEQIGAAIRARYNAKLLSCPAQERRARTPKQWADMYDEAMQSKRAAEKAARIRSYRKPKAAAA
jgi:hypothetical protein